MGHVDLNLGYQAANEILCFQPEAADELAAGSDQNPLERPGPARQSSFISVSWVIVVISNVAGAVGYLTLLNRGNQELAIDGGAIIAIASIAGLLFACRKLGHSPLSDSI